MGFALFVFFFCSVGVFVESTFCPPPPPITAATASFHRTQVTFDNVAGNYIWVAKVDPGNMTVAPAGLAFDRSLRANSALTLFQTDGMCV
jgi:hypothetical protein